MAAACLRLSSLGRAAAGCMPVVDGGTGPAACCAGSLPASVEAGLSVACAAAGRAGRAAASASFAAALYCCMRSPSKGFKRFCLQHRQTAQAQASQSRHASTVGLALPRQLQKVQLLKEQGHALFAGCRGVFEHEAGQRCRGLMWLRGGDRPLGRALLCRLSLQRGCPAVAGWLWGRLPAQPGQAGRLEASARRGELLGV